MSIQFDQPMNEETMQHIRKMFHGKIAVVDDRRVLLDDLKEAFNRRQMSDLARTAKQPVTLNLHGRGDIVEMSDGTKYQVTDRGWKKII